MKYQEKIRLIAEQRDVRVLLHFTQFRNLPHIVRHGVLSRSILQGQEYIAFASDRYRLDGNDDAVSVSISQLNERVFASKRRKNVPTDWVVLVLRADILWTHDCIFSWRNAAKKEIRARRGWRRGPWAFSQMFEGSVEDRKGLPPNQPTDDEAEVQVLEPIAPDRILGAVVYRPEMVEKVQAALEGLPGAKKVVFDSDPSKH